MISESLVLRLKSEDPLVRMQALDEASQDGDPDHLACLIEALSDRIDAVKSHARCLLRNITGRDYLFSKDDWSAWWRESANRTCLECGRRLYGHKLYYRIKTDITSEPTDLVFTDEDLNQDHRAEIKDLCESLADVSATDAEDEVFVRLEYFLCTRCKTNFVKSRRKLKDSSDP